MLGSRARRLTHREREHGPDALAARVQRIAQGFLEASQLRREGELAIRAKGMINNREQLESLFNAKELGVGSVQDFLTGSNSSYSSKAA